MSIASPQNRAELKQYIKTKLGAPVLQINVSDEQMDLAINDAFQYFYERQHFDAVERVYLSVEITQQLCDYFGTTTDETVTQPSGDATIKTENNFITLPKSVIGVSRILGTRSSGLMAGFPGFGVPLEGAFLVGAMPGYGSGMQFDLTSYYSMQQYLSTLNWLLYPPKSYSFNQRSHRLHLDTNDFYTNAKVGDYIVLECDVKADADMFPDVWDDMFLKRLSTAYVQLAWGRVLTKYQQVQLPGGITMNGDQIYNDAKQEIAEIQERFSMDYAMPPLDMIG